MFILLLVLISPPIGIPAEHILSQYSTVAECEQERMRIADEMAKVYPGDNSYRLVCRER